jgi:antirestriction protein
MMYATTRDLADPDELAELATLQAFAEEASGYASDWPYGETFVRDSYFRDYAQELADEIGAIPEGYSWPASHIDWDEAADALRQDYSSAELEGVTFWYRS